MTDINAAMYEFETPKFKLDDFLIAAKELDLDFYYTSSESLSSDFINNDGLETYSIENKGDARIEIVVIENNYEKMLTLEQMIPRPFYKTLHIGI